MPHDKKKKKGGYQQGGVVGTAEYSQRAFQKGGVVGTAEYSKRTGYKHGGISKKKKNAYEDGGIVKDYFMKRKGWDDMEDGKEKHHYAGGGYSTQDISGKEYKKRKGWGDEESVMKYKHRPIGGNAGNKDKFSKRKGWSENMSEHAYQDGGVVGPNNSVSAKLNALEDLRDQMSSIGGESLSNSFKAPNANAYEDGGIVESHDEEHESENRLDFDELSRDQLIALLKNK